MWNKVCIKHCFAIKTRHKGCCKVNWRWFGPSLIVEFTWLNPDFSRGFLFRLLAGTIVLIDNDCVSFSTVIFIAYRLDTLDMFRLDTLSHCSLIVSLVILFWFQYLLRHNYNAPLFLLLLLSVVMKIIHRSCLK